MGDCRDKGMLGNLALNLCQNPQSSNTNLPLDEEIVMKKRNLKRFDVNLISEFVTKCF